MLLRNSVAVAAKSRFCCNARGAAAGIAAMNPFNIALLPLSSFTAGPKKAAFEISPDLPAVCCCCCTRSSSSCSSSSSSSSSKKQLGECHAFATRAYPVHTCRCVFQSSFWQRSEQYLALRQRPHKLPVSTGFWQDQHARLRPLSTSFAIAFRNVSRRFLALRHLFSPIAAFCQISRRSEVALLRTFLSACTSSSNTQYITEVRS